MKRFYVVWDDDPSTFKNVDISFFSKYRGYDDKDINRISNMNKSDIIEISDGISQSQAIRRVQ